MGASLGADSIREGVTAAIVGVLVVMAFMLIYYRGSGINADLALFLNLVILLGFMGFSRADAHAARHCRSHSDHRHGRGLERADLRAHPRRDSCRQGAGGGGGPGLCACMGHHRRYARDHDRFGGHPVPVWHRAGEGLCTTLTFGLLANLFTAVFVSRVIFEAHLNKLKPGEMVSI